MRYAELTLFLAAIVGAMFGGWIAHKQGRNPIFWGPPILVYPPILLTLLVLPVFDLTGEQATGGDTNQPDANHIVLALAGLPLLAAPLLVPSLFYILLGFANSVTTEHVTTGPLALTLLILSYPAIYLVCLHTAKLPTKKSSRLAISLTPLVAFVAILAKAARTLTEHSYY